jgi:hypothetical protein
MTPRLFGVNLVAHSYPKVSLALTYAMSKILKDWVLLQLHAAEAFVA